MEFNVRKAREDDAFRIHELLKTIASLHHNGRPDLYSDKEKYAVSDIKEKLKRPDEIILVAADKNDFVLGYAISKIIDVPDEGVNVGHRKMYIDDVCVDENYRKNGIGRALLESSRREAADRGCHVVELNVFFFNETAVKFYESCGMKRQRMYMEYVLD